MEAKNRTIPTFTKANRPRTRRYLSVLVGALSWGGAALTDEPRMPRLDGVIDGWVAQEKIVGTVVMVARNGTVIYRRAAGYADRETGIPVTENTIFRLASMTKAIVSASALALAEQGRLSLDDKVQRWLPYFRPRLADGRRPDITIRQLLTHTSGLSYAFLQPSGNPYELLGLETGLERSDQTLEGVLRKLAGLPLFFEPGSAWSYSVSTDVLGAVIEQAAGMSLPSAVTRYVTGPLGMRDTAFGVVDTDRLAVAYRDGPAAAVRMRDEFEEIPIGTVHPLFSPDRILDPGAYPSGGSGMSGTADDYLRFLEAIRSGGSPIFGADSAALFTNHAIGDLRAWTEGDGWGHSLGAAVLLDPAAAHTPQNTGTWQWGGVLGTHWFVDPGESLTVVVLTNTSVAGVIGDFPARVRDAIYADLFR